MSLEGLVEEGLTTVVEHHLQVLSGRTGEQQRDVPHTRTDQSRSDDRQWLSRTAIQALELIEADDDMVGQSGKRSKLGVEHLGSFRGLTRPAAHRALEDLQVEADLPFEHLELALCGPAHGLLRVLLERVVDAGDERGDAQRALEVDPDHDARRRVGLVLECQLTAKRRAVVVFPVARGPEISSAGSSAKSASSRASARRGT
ncbi:MAG TPA: hypothetical protein VGG98_05185 [Solirubrobacteraceae bacterium]